MRSFSGSRARYKQISLPRDSVEPFNHISRQIGYGTWKSASTSITGSISYHGVEHRFCGPGRRGPHGYSLNLGLVGGLLDFLGSQPFVLLFLTLALGTRLGRKPLSFIKPGSTAGTLLVGILINLAVHQG